MGMYNWAKRECMIACGIKDDSVEFEKLPWDYGIGCYQSALKAFKSICEDDHSGFSFNMTKGILEMLLDSRPLTKIKDEDFFINDESTVGESEEYLKERGLKSCIQCPRLGRLFRYETLDGKVYYRDVERAYCINIEHPSDTYTTGTPFLDEMFPITMPYMPEKEPFRIYQQSFLRDKKNGDFDTRATLYLITPEGRKVNVGIYEMEGEDHKWKRISKKKYEELLKQRIDTVGKKTSSHIMWTLLENSSSEKQSALRRAAFNRLSDVERNKIYDELDELCKFYDDPSNYKFNTFNVEQDLAKGRLDEYKNIPGLMAIGNYLQKILDKLVAVNREENNK